MFKMFQESISKEIYYGMFYKILIWYLLYYEFAYATLTPVVEITQGKLRGVRLLGQDRYLSIPYATSSRFQNPKRPPKWKGIYHAVNPLVTCPQAPLALVFGSEDCLHLDVYVPEWAKPTDRLPVMVYFHGGAYYHGRKGLYDPQFLVTKGVVVVTINYRLGVLGFLCLAGVSNLGLRDQVAALKWVNKNIRSFSGDPDNVTLCGQSAGASSASMHLLSELSKGLFHKAILMSGTVLAPWAFNVEPLKPALEDARKISPAETENDVLNIFKNASLNTLVSATRDVSTNPRYFKYAPCVDMNNTEPFFSDAPYNLLKSGRFNRVPIIIGYTDNEGGLFYTILEQKLAKDLNDNFNNHLPSVFSWCSEDDKRKISQMIRQYYFSNKTIDKTRFRELNNFYSDWVSYGSTGSFSKLMAQVSGHSVFNYQFSYEGHRNFVKGLTGFKFDGAMHGDGLFYIFKPEGISLPLSNRDRMFVEKITTLIRNFMKYGNPTPKKTKVLPVLWPAASPNSSYVMVLDENLAVLREPREEHRGEFFRRILCAYGKDGYVPCESAQMCSQS